ncbi:MAG: N-acetylneuraminate synthase family protein [Sneathiellaceae bacterium]
MTDSLRQPWHSPDGPWFIAEVSSNHETDLDRCLAFVDAAAAAGCAAVKFQLFKIDKLFAPEILAQSERHRARRAWELPEAFLPEIAAHARGQGLAFACTPFDLEAVETLRPHVDFYKIASYELLWLDLVRAAAATGRPLVLSTGMATLDECRAAAQTARAAGCTDLTVLHCVSHYPAMAAEANLAAIATLREALGCAVGWSDHTTDPAVIQRAVHRWGAGAVECHIDLEGDGAEFASGHCWLPAELQRTIAEIGRATGADGSGAKGPVPAEAEEREWRADPADGLRPLKYLRQSWKAEP